MRRGKFIVEQVNTQGKIVEDLDEFLSPKDLRKIIVEKFPGARIEKNHVYINLEGQEFGIFAKNITYLGNPHPAFKKRIQIPNTFKNFYEENSRRGIRTILLGMYTYKENLIFCDFSPEDYLGAVLHNSSAHVYTNDLQHATKSGIFQKIDYNHNKIVVFRPDMIETVLKAKIQGRESFQDEVVDFFDRFFDSLAVEWDGISCYEEMQKNEYKQANQSEWAGFFLEYKLEEFILAQGEISPVKKLHNKKQDDTDLDLYLVNIGAYGDLKAHSITSPGIQGNDKSSLDELLKSGNIYYVVLDHDTVRDSECGYEVTFFWNKMLGKENLYSYGKRMKNRVKLREYSILEITKDNQKYLSEFKQGKNSNGRPRAPKISITKSNIKHFIIHSRKLS